MPRRKPKPPTLAQREPILSPEHREQVLAYLSQGTGLKDALTLLRLSPKRVVARLKRLYWQKEAEAVELVVSIRQARVQYVRDLHVALRGHFITVNLSGFSARLGSCWRHGVCSRR